MDWTKASSKWGLSQFETVQRLTHCKLKIGPGVNVIMPRAGDGSIEDQVWNVRAERVGALPRHYLVLLTGEYRDRHAIALQRRRSVDLVAEERSDRDPRIHRLGDGFQRIERRHEDEPVELALRRQ